MPKGHNRKSTWMRLGGLDREESRDLQSVVEMLPDRNGSQGTLARFGGWDKAINGEERD